MKTKILMFLVLVVLSMGLSRPVCETCHRHPRFVCETVPQHPRLQVCWYIAP